MGLQVIYREGASTVTTHAHKYGFHYRNGCDACPLRDAPKIKPYGAARPVVYMLGEAPGREEVSEGRAFVGAPGKMLRKHIPKRWNNDKLLRWNNCLLSRPPDSRTPTPIELASCRSYLEDDICAAKPKVIMGFGAVPLQWMGIADAGITAWAGRCIPVNIRGHECWYFPMLHPSFVNLSNDEVRRASRDEYKSETEFAFHMHLKRAFELVDDLEWLGEPHVHTRANAMEHIAWPTRFDRATANQIIRWIEAMYDERVVGFDYETNAIRPYESSLLRPQHPEPKILTAALAGSKGTMAWPIRHREAAWPADLLDEIEVALSTFLHKSTCIKAVHSLSFEMEWTAIFYGRKAIRTPHWGDTMAQAYILDERPGASNAGPGPFSLDWLTRQHFGFSIKSLNPVDRKDLDNVPLREVLPYNGCDAKYHRELFLSQRRWLKRAGLVETYNEHLRRIRATVFTAIKGLPINSAVNERLLKKYEAKRDAIADELATTPECKQFFADKGYHLRPQSGPDTIHLLQNILPAKATKRARNRDGVIANAAEGTLSQVNHPVAKLLLAYRKQHKVISTYLLPVRNTSPLIFDDGLGHPITQTVRTRTWRTSASDWNYQNWPKRDEDRREVRQQVDPGKGYVVASFDFAGIQARNVAMESRDAALVKAFRERYDIHTDWCEEIARIAPEWVKEGVKELARDKKLFKAYRNRAKNEFVFPSFFGAQGTTVAHYLGIDDRKGVKVQDKFWTRFSGVHDWHEALFKSYRRKGYVEGLSGFRRRAPISHNELINSPIQSDEAVIVCDAFARLTDMRRNDLQPNMEIHDDLTFIWPEDRVDEYAPIVIDTMLNCPFEWAQIVPLGVEFLLGQNWFQQKVVGEYFTDTWQGKL
jgi:uracil-DNA glycosylase family 4